MARKELDEQRSIVQERMEIRMNNIRKKYENLKMVKLPQIKARQFKGNIYSSTLHLVCTLKYE